MYRHLVRAVPIERPVRLGYIVLPKDTSQVGERLAEWDDALLATADAKALEVLRAIRDEKFWPRQDDTTPHPLVSGICGHLPGRPIVGRHGRR